MKILISFIVFATAFIGSILTDRGLPWYQTVEVPSWTPSGQVIGIVWTILFILLALTMLIFSFQNISHKQKVQVYTAFYINCILNVLWTYLFFTVHVLFWAFIEAIFLGISVFVLMFFIWESHKSLRKKGTYAFLLLPYALWVFFASYLTYSIYLLNT